MKTILTLILTLRMFSSQGQALWSDTTFVKRQNQNIIDGYGTTIKLDGVNVGGWLMWEGWIWGGGFSTETQLVQGISNKLGVIPAENFRDSVYKNYITRADIERISQQCFNVVRIPFNHAILEDDTNPFVYKNSGWALLDSVLNWCEIYNVYAVLDLHSAPGGQSTLFTADPDPIDLWSSPQNQQRTIQLWKAIAQRYNNRGIIAGYDLLNEPNTTNNPLLLSLYQNIIDTIRTVDTNHMFFIEGNDYAQDFSMFTSLLDSNIAFEFHIYTWFGADVQQELTELKTFSQNLNVPIWCGEWGDNDLSNLTSQVAEFRNSTYNVSGNAFWTWKKQFKFIQYPCYNCYYGTFTWDKVTEWINNNTSPQPTVIETQQGVNDFLNNIKFQKTYLNNSLNSVLEVCSIVGIDEISNQTFSIFPNPSNGHLTIIRNHIDENCIITIYDPKGRVLLSEQHIEGSTFEIDLDNFTNGIYFIRLDTGKYFRTNKFIVKQ